VGDLLVQTRRRRNRQLSACSGGHLNLSPGRLRLAERWIEAKGLRALTRAREDLVATRVALANQLRTELERYWPGAAVIFKDIDSPISLAFIKRYPQPGRRPRARRPAPRLVSRAPRVLRRQAARAADPQTQKRARGTRRRPGDRGASRGGARTRDGYRAARGQDQRADLEIGHCLRAHPDGHIFLSLFKGKSVVTAAELLAEIGDCRDRYPTADALAADAGMSPVAIESGKRKVAAFCSVRPTSR
jgi:hypothetical protein